MTKTLKTFEFTVFTRAGEKKIEFQLQPVLPLRWVNNQTVEVNELLFHRHFYGAGWTPWRPVLGFVGVAPVLGRQTYACLQDVAQMLVD